VNLILDTHTLLWWLNDEATLSLAARSAIADPDNTVYLSAVVIWEIRIKEAIGKLTLPPDFREVLDEQGFVELAIRVAHAHALRDLPPIHRDPFDRLLVAQAVHEGMLIATHDRDIARYGVGIVVA
jgi:PIN domain nuclease of toxin-antitoxin system